MGRLSALLLAFLLGASSAVALASCGGGDSDLLPGTSAEQIESNLDAVEQLAADQDCIGAEDAVAEVTAEVEELEGVDLKLKAALQEGTGRLSEVVAECEEETTSEETEPSIETAVGAEEVEDEKKPKKEKPEKEAKEPSQPEEEAESEGPELPPQANGKGEENGGGEPPAEPEAEETPPSGGVGPGVGVE